jgi:hypothetical protein
MLPNMTLIGTRPHHYPIYRVAAHDIPALGTCLQAIGFELQDADYRYQRQLYRFQQADGALIEVDGHTGRVDCDRAGARERTAPTTGLERTERHAAGR